MLFESPWWVWNLRSSDDWVNLVVWISITKQIPLLLSNHCYCSVNLSIYPNVSIHNIHVLYGLFKYLRCSLVWISILSVVKTDPHRHPQPAHQCWASSGRTCRCGCQERGTNGDSAGANPKKKLGKCWFNYEKWWEMIGTSPMNYGFWVCLKIVYASTWSF